jgi:anti-sigma B factor antagonist
MDIRTKKITNSVVLVELSGKFNIEEVFHFEEYLDEIMNNMPSAIAINMEEIKYIDSSGIGSLIKTMNIAKGKNIDLVITSIDKEILHIFKIAYLDRFFSIMSYQEFLDHYSK